MPQSPIPEMASPTIKRGKTRVHRSIPAWQLKLSLPLLVRRSCATLVEVSLVAASALIPYTIGLYASHLPNEPVPLNPVLATTEEAIAKTLALPTRGRITPQVPPLTNLFWCIALIAPIGVAGWQLYLLAQTGKTSPKRWYGVQIVTDQGLPPGFGRVILREILGRWGIPVGIAYSIWRYSGAFPDLTILLGLTGAMLLVESLSGLFHSGRRTLHDQFAGTYAIDGGKNGAVYVESPYNTYAVRDGQPIRLEVQSNWEEDSYQRPETVTTIVLTSQRGRYRFNLWEWMRQHPGLTLLLIATAGMVSILGTFVGTQIYIQSQANWRDSKRENNQVFLALVKQLSSNSVNATEDQRAAMLALARLDDPRAVPFLVDLLGQEKNSALIDAIAQALVGSGTKALPPLQKLNQALQNDRQALGSDNQEDQLIALRQRASQRALAQLLSIYSSQLHNADLGRVNFATVNRGDAQFTLVLDKIDLSGINFRGASLTGASLRGSRFYGLGEDGRLGTFDDWIADLSGTDLKEADLTGAILSRVVMNRSNLMRATLNQANLTDVSLIGANLSSAKLIKVECDRCNLENASLTGADLAESKLSGSNLHNVRAGRVSAIKTQFPFAQITGSDWQGADLSGADFSNANLQDADLQETKLVGTNFSRANLQNVNFQNVNLSAADLRGATLTGADFKGATFAVSPTNQSAQFLEAPPPANLAPIVKGVDFSEAKNLTNKQVSYLCSLGAIHPQCP